MKRFTILFSGSVQGVGFRYTACRIADDHTVRGYVRNLRDGRVELVAEGEPEELERFLENIESAMRGHIRERFIDRGPATGEFSDFRVTT